MSKRITTIGGQALMEGIMMVGPKRSTAAFCDAQGNVTTEDISFEPLTKKYPILALPFVRGIFAMIDSYRRGYKALSLSADRLLEDEPEEPGKLDKWLEDHLGEKMTGAIMTIAMVLGVGLAVVLFYLLPTMLFNGLNSLAGGSIEPIRAIFEGVFRFAIFLLYIVLISFMPDIKRTFMYHGAEHKTIFCYENELPLTVEHIRGQSRFHPRCGTSFMVLMLLLGIVVGFFIPFTNPLLRTATKLLTIPLVMNVGYELLKLCARHDNLLVRIITAPGLWMQRITTKEPDDNMIEAAIAAMVEVIPENGEDLVQ